MSGIKDNGSQDATSGHSLDPELTASGLCGDGETPENSLRGERDPMEMDDSMDGRNGVMRYPSRVRRT